MAQSGAGESLARQEPLGRGAPPKALEQAWCSPLLPHRKRPHRQALQPQPPEPSRQSSDHNVTVPPLSSGTLGPLRLLAVVAVAWASRPRLPWVLPLPAVPCCLGAHPRFSPLPAPGSPPARRPAAPPPLPSSLRSSACSQSSGNSTSPSGLGGGRPVSRPHLHAAAGPCRTAPAHRAGAQGRAAGKEAAADRARALVLVHGTGQG